MAESASRTLTCSVLFAELAGYASLPVSEQLRRKRLLKAQVAQEVVQVPMAERIVHEIETGVAVAFLVDVEAVHSKPSQMVSSCFRSKTSFPRVPTASCSRSRRSWLLLGRS
jgi:hypothetical protein